MDVDDLLISMLLSIEKGHWIMVARNPQNFALKDIVQPCEAFLREFNHFPFAVALVLVVAVRDIAAHQTVVEVLSVGLDRFGKTRQHVQVEVDI